MAQGSRVFIELYSDSKITPRATASVNNTSSLAYRERARGRKRGREGPHNMCPRFQHDSLGNCYLWNTSLHRHTPER